MQYFNFFFFCIPNRPITDKVPDDWVTITENGVIVVGVGIIDCDDPPRELVVYRVILKDALHYTYGKVTIKLIDTNNRTPVISEHAAEIKILEKLTLDQTVVVTISSTDIDRDGNFIINILT